jgi:hypothetical protein
LVRVKHFSRYGLDNSDSEDDAIGTTTAASAVGARKPRQQQQQLLGRLPPTKSLAQEKQTQQRVPQTANRLGLGESSSGESNSDDDSVGENGELFNDRLSPDNTTVWPYLCAIVHILLFVCMLFLFPSFHSF